MQSLLLDKIPDTKLGMLINKTNASFRDKNIVIRKWNEKVMKMLTSEILLQS